MRNNCSLRWAHISAVRQPARTMLANSLVKSALLLQRVSALKHVSVCVRCCANQSEQPPSSSFADAARDQRGHAVLQYWCVRWAQDVNFEPILSRDKDMRWVPLTVQ